MWQSGRPWLVGCLEQVLFVGYLEDTVVDEHVAARDEETFCTPSSTPFFSRRGTKAIAPLVQYYSKRVQKKQGTGFNTRPGPDRCSAMPRRVF